MQWPTLVTIVGPLAGHLLPQMLHMTLINGLCYPCSMHAHCPSDHSLFPWSICCHPNYPLLHTWWWTLGIIWTCLFFLSFFLFRVRCFDVKLCTPPGTSQLTALATLARIANLIYNYKLCVRPCVRASVRRRSGSVFCGGTGHRDFLWRNRRQRPWPPATSDPGPETQVLRAKCSSPRPQNGQNY